MSAAAATPEEQLWRAAEVLRGAVDAGTYHHLVLALLLVRGPGALSVPSVAAWSALAAAPAEGLAERLDAALAAIESANPPLAGALPARFVAAGLDGDRLHRLVAAVGAIALPGAAATPVAPPAEPPAEPAAEAAAEADAIGRAYEYYLGAFSRDAGRGGEFFTPGCVADLLAAVAPPRGVVYDPCCGTGGLFVHARAPGVRYVGQESNPTTWRLARANLARRGLPADLGPRPADSLTDDLHPGLRADVVLANPPFNMVPPALDPADPRWVHGLPAARNANFAWLQHVLAHLAPSGHAAVVLANGSLTGRRAGEGALRTALVRSGRVEGVIALPPQLFYSTSIPACVWLLGPGRGSVLFVDATALGGPAGRTLRVLHPPDVARVAGVVRRWRAGEPIDEAGLARAVPMAEVEASGFLLSPGRHVRAAPPEAPAESLPALVLRLEAALAEASQADDALRAALHAVRGGSP